MENKGLKTIKEKSLCNKNNGTVCKWELRCQDRRAAMSVPKIFFKLKEKCKLSKFKIMHAFLSESVKQRGKSILLVT